MPDPASDDIIFASPQGASNVLTQHSGLVEEQAIANAASNLMAVEWAGIDDGYGNIIYQTRIFEYLKTSATPTGFDSTPTPIAELGAAGGVIGGLALDGAGDLYFKSGGLEYELARDPASATGYAAAPVPLANLSQPSWYFGAQQVASSDGLVFGSGIRLDGDDAYFLYEVGKDPPPDGYAYALPRVFTASAAHSYTASTLAVASDDNLFAIGWDFAQDVSLVQEFVRDPASATGYAATPIEVGAIDGYFESVSVGPKGDLFVWTPNGPVYEIARDAAAATGYAAPVMVGSYPGAEELVVDGVGNLFAVVRDKGLFEYARDDASSTGYAAPVLVSDLKPSFYPFGVIYAGGDKFVVYDGPVSPYVVSVETGVTPCYCRGTRIVTDRGEVAVEDLAVGDRVFTLSGAPKPIRWIGRRSYAGRLAAGNPAVMPVCFLPGALADNSPRRELWVSPEHAMYIDGALVPAGLLVNGVSIRKVEAVEEVHYFHIELDAHDVIYAEGAPSETFVDDGGRGVFHNAPDYYAAHPEAARPGPAVYCAPRLEDGPALDALRIRLAARAPRIGAGVVSPADIDGCLDRAERTILAGWACDRLAPQRRIEVVALCNGAVLAQVVADRYRADLEAAGWSDGRHSFELTLTTPLASDRRHEIELRSAEDWRLLQGSPIVIEEAPAQGGPGPLRGHVDHAGATRVTGWALDESRPSEPVALVVSVDGRELGRVTANRRRSDLAHFGGVGARHGFDFVIPGGLSRAQAQEIRVRRAADGAEVENSPYLLPAAEGDEGLADALAAVEAAAANAADEDAALLRLAGAAEALLARRAERTGGLAEREALAAHRRRWGGAETDSAPFGPRALVIDERAPSAGLDAGSSAILSHMRALRELGYSVDFAACDGETGGLAEALGPPLYAGVEDVLRRHARGFDLVYLHRLASAERYLSLARAYQPGARVVYSVGDLHHVRLARQARIERRPELLARARAAERAEMHAAVSADIVLTHSPVEAHMLSRWIGGRARVAPFAVGERREPPAFAERWGVGFLGSFGHEPNVDAAFWLTREILPRVWARAPDVTCVIAGAGWRADALGPLDRRVEIVGPVEDLDSFFGGVRLTVAPLRFGAGIKGKVLESFAAATPCVMSEIAAEGLPQLVGLVARDDEAFAAATLWLHEDATANAAAGAQARAAASAFTQERVTEALGRALGPGAPQRAAWV